MSMPYVHDLPFVGTAGYIENFLLVYYLRPMGGRYWSTCGLRMIPECIRAMFTYFTAGFHVGKFLLNRQNLILLVEI